MPAPKQILVTALIVLVTIYAARKVPALNNAVFG